MKYIKAIFFLSVILIAFSCSDVRRKPGAIYMPDMAYSRAYETYAQRDSSFTTDINSNADKIFYNNMPVAGTVARGEQMPFPYAKDATGDSTNYLAAKQVINPLPALNVTDKVEAERLYLVNCAICHGMKLDGNGPLYKDGNGPFAAQPANFVDPNYKSGTIYKMAEGQMFYSITYGKNLMGPYASQLSRKQRWMIIHYIKSKQAPTDSTAKPSADTTLLNKQKNG